MDDKQLQFRREVMRSDMSKLRKWMQDEQVTEHLNEDQNIGAKLQRAVQESSLPIFTPQLNRNGRFFLLTLPDKGPVGFLRLASKADAAEIVVVLGEPDIWGKGYGYRAVRKGLRHAFYEMRKERVVAKIHKGNTRSKHVFRKAGFSKDADLEEEEKFSMELADMLM